MRTIFGKLWLGIISLVIVIISLVWIFQVVFLDKFYIEERKHYLSYKGDKVASMLLENNLMITDDIKEELDSFLPSLDIFVLVADNKENIIFYSNPGNKSLNNRKPQFDLNKEKIFEKEIYISSKRFPPFDSSFILVKTPIIHQQNLLGNIILASPLAPIRETTGILKKQLSIITLISLLIASLLSLAFAKYFSKPILKITNAAKRISNGDFTTKVDIKSKDEIGALGKTINDMSKQLGQTEVLRKEFVANVSHEFKTPISLIKAYGELVKDNIESDEKNNQEYLDVIIDESDRLNNMIEDILYLSKMEAGIYKLECNNFSILELINQVIEKINYFAIQKNIQIKVKADDDATVFADESKMYQVFYNLISNAINYSFNNSTVSIQIKNKKDKVRVEVSDNGIGIPKEDIPHIWDRFYKADKSRKRNNSGTGLGMAIVKNILDTHNFKYGIESKVNNGTLIWVEM